MICSCLFSSVLLPGLIFKRIQRVSAILKSVWHAAKKKKKNKHKNGLFSNRKELLYCASWFGRVLKSKGELVSRKRASRVLIQALLIICFFIRLPW